MHIFYFISTAQDVGYENYFTDEGSEGQRRHLTVILRTKKIE